MATVEQCPCIPSAHGHHRSDFADLSFQFRQNAAGVQLWIQQDDVNWHDDKGGA